VVFERDRDGLMAGNVMDWVIKRFIIYYKDTSTVHQDELIGLENRFIFEGFQMFLHDA
jgi:hypothetical protein